MLEHSGEFFVLDPRGKRHHVNVWRSPVDASQSGQRDSNAGPQVLTLDDGTELIRISRGVYERMGSVGIAAVRYTSNDPNAV